MKTIVQTSVVEDLVMILLYELSSSDTWTDLCEYPITYARPPFSFGVDFAQNVS